MRHLKEDKLPPTRSEINEFTRKIVKSLKKTNEIEVIDPVTKKPMKITIKSAEYNEPSNGEPATLSIGLNSDFDWSLVITGAAEGDE